MATIEAHASPQAGDFLEVASSFCIVLAIVLSPTLALVGQRVPFLRTKFNAFTDRSGDFPEITGLPIGAGRDHELLIPNS